MRSVMTLVAFLLLASMVAAADIVELKSGERIEGTFKGANDVSVRIESSGRLLTFKPEEVRAIYYGAELGAPTTKNTGEEALRTLKELQAITAAKPSYSEYRGRLTYARFHIDLLSAKLTDPALRSAILASVDFFSVAGDAWAAMMRPPARERADDVRAVMQKSQGECPPLKHLLSAKADEVADGVLPAAWACAAEKITEVEKLLGHP
jgi:hypothetical protein